MIRSTILGSPGVNAFKRTVPGFGLRREAKHHAALAGEGEVFKSGVAAALCHRSPKSRMFLARERARIARAMLADCRFCEHLCGVNRLVGETGLCHADAETRIFFGANRSVGRTGIDPDVRHRIERLRSALRFLHHGRRRSWNPRAGAPVRLKEMAERADAALAKRRAHRHDPRRRADDSSAGRAGNCRCTAGRRRSWFGKPTRTARRRRANC